MWQVGNWSTAGGDLASCPETVGAVTWRRCAPELGAPAVPRPDAHGAYEPPAVCGDSFCPLRDGGARSKGRTALCRTPLLRALSLITVDARVLRRV